MNPDSARLAVCERASGVGGLDGVWWPASPDLGTELPDLVTVVGAWIGPISRVVYDRRAWLPAPRRIINGPTSVTLDAYRLVARDTIYLRGTHSRDAVLFALPPTSSMSTVRRILDEVTANSRPVTIALVRQLLLISPEDS